MPYYAISGLQRAIRVAAANGHFEIVDQLLADSRVDLCAYGDFPLRAAAANGHVATLERLLADRRVNPTALRNGALRLAACYGHDAAVRHLLADDRIGELNLFDTELIVKAACSSAIAAVQVVETVLASPRVIMTMPIMKAAVRAAASVGNLAVLDHLLAGSRVVLSAEVLSGALQAAARQGHVVMVDRFLKLLPGGLTDRVAPASLAGAAQAGHLAVVDRLLSERSARSRPAVAAALYSAAIMGHVAVFDRLAAELPAAAEAAHWQLTYVVLQQACLSGHADIVARLLANASLLPSSWHLWHLQAGLYTAACSGHADCVEIMLADGRLDLSAPFYNTFPHTRSLHNGPARSGSVAACVLEGACASGRLDVVERLLADPAMPAGDAGLMRFCRSLAARNVRPSILKRLEREAGDPEPGRDPHGLPQLVDSVTRSALRQRVPCSRQGCEKAESVW